MFKIYDGREYFYQWDLDRKMIVYDETIQEVHFWNKTDDCCLVCEVYTEGNLRLVNVPNILLQDNWRINAYGYDGSYTKHSDRFDVKSRAKPSDYVYTETEIKHYNDLEERITALEENGVTSGGGNGLTNAMVNALDGLFKLAVYKENANTQYISFRVAFGLDDSGSDDPDIPTDPDIPIIPTYTITNNLTSVINSNGAVKANEGESYTAELTLEDDYEWSSLVITMGGVDVTESVYGDGFILIPSVSGDVVITAVAEKPMDIDMAVLNPNFGTINHYDDSGAQIDYNNHHAVSASAKPTQKDVLVTVKMFNPTDQDITATVIAGGILPKDVMGTTKQYIYYSTQCYNGTIRANKSIKFTYTVPSGYHLGVEYSNADLICSANGVLDITAPENQYETTTSKKHTTLYRYVGADDTTTSSYTNNIAYAYTELFENDKKIRLTLVNNTEASIGGISVQTGAVDGTGTNKIYYYQSAFIGGALKPGFSSSFELNAYAGYAFAYYGIPSGVTVYLEDVKEGGN